jgi:hypothetical protein
MEYGKFIQLIKTRENTRVDFKIQCDAFLSKDMGPKAELAKDICAMSNNGNVVSYIIIGISDDGMNFLSVSNNKLTNDNLQAFCKTAIFPPPKVKLFWKLWKKNNSKIAGKNFVIIQIGPQARFPYRLNRDFISYPEKICYRRNEVWIRREATSDIASPEEIARLFKASPSEEIKVENNIEYGKLLRHKQTEYMIDDLKKCVEESGGIFNDKLLALKINKVRFVWRCISLIDCNGNYAITNIARKDWRYEHGILILVKGKVYRNLLDPISTQRFWSPPEVNFKDKWGWFTRLSFGIHPEVPMPDYQENLPTMVFTLPNLTDTNNLRKSFFDFLHFLESDKNSFEIARKTRNQINSYLRKWLKKGWPISTNLLQPGYPGFRTFQLNDLIEMAQTVIELSGK